MLDNIDLKPQSFDYYGFSVHCESTTQGFLFRFPFPTLRSLNPNLELFTEFHKHLLHRHQSHHNTTKSYEFLRVDKCRTAWRDRTGLELVRVSAAVDKELFPFPRKHLWRSFLFDKLVLRVFFLFFE